MTAPGNPTASEAGDDDIQDGRNAYTNVSSCTASPAKGGHTIDDGHDDASDTIHDSAKDISDGTEDRLDL